MGVSPQGGVAGRLKMLSNVYAPRFRLPVPRLQP